MKTFYRKYLLLLATLIVCVPAMGGVTVETVGKNEVSADVSAHFSINIDRPAKEVWPHLIKFESWMEDFSWTHVSGKPNTEGEVLHLHHESIPSKDRSESNALIVKAVNIIPMRLSHHINPLLVTPDGSLHFGTNILTLHEKNGKTKVDFYANKSLKTSSKTEGEVRSSLEAFSKSAAKRWQEVYLPRLKSLVEAS